jgi:hypothetical protein
MVGRLTVKETDMKVYIQSTKEYLPHNHNFFSAYQGFAEMGSIDGYNGRGGF